RIPVRRGGVHRHASKRSRCGPRRLLRPLQGRSPGRLLRQTASWVIHPHAPGGGLRFPERLASDLAVCVKFGDLHGPSALLVAQPRAFQAAEATGEQSSFPVAAPGAKRLAQLARGRNWRRGTSGAPGAACPPAAQGGSSKALQQVPGLGSTQQGGGRRRGSGRGHPEYCPRMRAHDHPTNLLIRKLDRKLIAWAQKLDHGVPGGFGAPRTEPSPAAWEGIFPLPPQTVQHLRKRGADQYFPGPAPSVSRPANENRMPVLDNAERTRSAAAAAPVRYGPPEPDTAAAVC